MDTVRGIRILISLLVILTNWDDDHKIANSLLLQNEDKMDLNLRNRLDMMLTDELKNEAEKISFHGYTLNSGIGNREALYLSSVEENEFNYGSGVYQWYSLSRTPKAYLLGLSEKKLILITIGHQKHKNESVLVTEIVIPANPIMASMLEWWNATSERTEIICVVALNTSVKDVIWYRFENERLEKFLSWQYHKSITYLMVISVGVQLKLIIVNDVDNSMDVYDIKLGFTAEYTNMNFDQKRKQQFTLSQSPPLLVSSWSLAASSVSDLVYLFVSQPGKDMILIYKAKIPSNPETISNFAYHNNISCSGVKELSTFVIAHQNYLAISGEQPAIYKIKPNGQLINDLKSNLGPVDKWIPINVQTYRDDILLLVHEQGAEATKFFSWRGIEQGFIKLSDSPHNLDHVIGDFGRCTDFLLGPPSLAHPSLLVPYKNGTSKLYNFITNLQKQDNPMLFEIQKLHVTKNFLLEFWQEQKKYLSDLQNRKKWMFKNIKTNIITSDWTIENILTPRLFLRENVANENLNNKTVSSEASSKQENSISNKVQKINHTVEMIKFELDSRKHISDRLHNFGKASGRVTVYGKTFIKNAEINDRLNGIIVEKLLQDTFRLDQPKKIKGLKTIATLKADKINVKRINDTLAENLLFIDGPVIIEGNLTLNNNLVVNGDIILSKKGLLNGIDPSEDILLLDKKYSDPLRFDMLETRNINVKEMNGKNLLSLVQQINLPDKTWNNVQAGHNLTVKNVNGMDWDNLIESTVWLNKNSFVKGRITVKGNIINNGDIYINTTDSTDYPGINLETSEDTFFSYKRSEDSTTEGVLVKRNRCTDVSNFNENEVKTIKGDVIAKDVSVAGIVSTLNVKNPELLNALKDIVYKTNSESEPVIIHGTKTFSNLNINSTLSVSGLVKNYNTSEFLTVDTKQTLKGKKIFNKKVVFDNVYITGTWNDVNVTELRMKSIYKHGDQLSGLSLTNEENSRVGKIIKSTGKDNKTDKTKGFTLKESFDKDYAENVFYLDMNATILEVFGNITVEGLLGRENLNKFKILIDLTKKDFINDDITVQKATIDHLSVDIINNYAIKNNDSYCERFLINGNTQDIRINEFVVDGNIETKKGVSGYNITEINRSAIGLERNNNVEGEIIFEDEIECESLDVSGYINGGHMEFSKVIHDIVKKSDKNVVIPAKKTFNNKLFIDGDLSLKYLNEMKFSNILMKQGNQEIKGKLKIVGKSIIKDLQVKGYFNNANYTYLKTHHEYLNKRTHVWRGDIEFKKAVTVENVTVLGFVNNINFKEFVKNLYLDSEDEMVFSGPKGFKKNVKINGNMKVKNNFNDIDVNKFFDDIVLINQPSAIKEDVIFNDKIIFRDGLNVDYDMNTSQVHGCNLKELSKNAINLHQSDIVQGSITFVNAASHGNIKSKSINDIDLSHAFLLNKKQTIFGTVNFDKITVLNDVPVSKLVSNYWLPEEYENTLLTENNQTIDNKHFINGKVIVKGDLISSNTFNNKLIQNVVKLRGDNLFLGSFNFDCVKLNSHLLTGSNTLSGINIQEWEKTAVLKDNNQNISGVWNIKGNLTLNSVDGNGTLNNFELYTLDNKMDLWRAEQIDFQYNIKVNYSEECTAVDSMAKTATSQLYELQNFEISQNLTHESYIESIHMIKLQGEDYLIVSSNATCKISAYKWNQVNKMYEDFFEQQVVNSISSMISLEFNNETFLMTKPGINTSKDNQNCGNETGSILWKYDPENKQFQVIQKLGDDNDILLSNINNHKDGTFYTQSKICITKWTISKDGDGKYKADKKCNKNFFDDVTSTQELINKINTENQYKPLVNRTNNDTIITEYNINPWSKYTCFAVIEYPELQSRTDFVKIYKPDGSLYHKITALKPKALSWLDVRGQNWISFIENSTSLQVYQFEDSKTEFVNKLSFNTTAVNMVTGSLPIKNKLNPMPFIILQIDATTIYIIKGNMAGDPYQGPIPECKNNKGIS